MPGLIGALMAEKKDISTYHAHYFTKNITDW